MPKETNYYLEHNDKDGTIIAKTYERYEEYHDFPSNRDYTRIQVVGTYSYSEFLEIKGSLGQDWDIALKNFPTSCDIIWELERRLKLTNMRLEEIVQELDWILPKSDQSWNKEYKSFLKEILSRNIESIKNVLNIIKP